MSVESSKPTNQGNPNKVIPPSKIPSKIGSLNFESLSRSNLDNYSREKSELFFKHQKCNSFLKEKRNTQDQAIVSPELSDASNINTNTKAPNVFAAPHFRTRINATRLSFKDFQKKEINNLPNLSATQNHIDQSVPLFTTLFSKKSGKVTNEPFILNLPNSFNKESIKEKENLNQENLNQGNALDNKKDADRPNQELPIHEIHNKPNDTFNQLPSIQERPEETSDQEACVECSLLDNTLPHFAQQSSSPIDDKFSDHSPKFETSSPLLNNDYLQIDDNEMLTENIVDIPEQNDKYIIEKSNIFNKSLPKNDQNSSSDDNSSITRNNSDKVFSFPGGKPSRNNSSSQVQKQMQGSNTNNQQPKFQNDAERFYFHDKINSSNHVQIMTNLNKDNNISPATEHNNSETKDHLYNDNELNLIVGTVQKWKDEVVKRDYLIGELVRRDILQYCLIDFNELMYFFDSTIIISIIRFLRFAIT
jgi:hypothetical protein